MVTRGRASAERLQGRQVVVRGSPQDRVNPQGLEVGSAFPLSADGNAAVAVNGGGHTGARRALIGFNANRAHSPVFKCPVCAKRFPSRALLGAHLRENELRCVPDEVQSSALSALGLSACTKCLHWYAGVKAHEAKCSADLAGTSDGAEAEASDPSSEPSSDEPLDVIPEDDILWLQSLPWEDMVYAGTTVVVPKAVKPLWRLCHQMALSVVSSEHHDAYEMGWKLHMLLPLSLIHI